MNGTTVKPTKRSVPRLELPTTDHPRICKTCPEPQPVEERELTDYLEIQAQNLWPAPKSLHQRIMQPEIVIKKSKFPRSSAILRSKRSRNFMKISCLHLFVAAIVMPMAAQLGHSNGSHLQPTDEIQLVHMSDLPKLCHVPLNLL